MKNSTKTFAKRTIDFFKPEKTKIIFFFMFPGLGAVAFGLLMLAEVLPILSPLTMASAALFYFVDFPVFIQAVVLNISVDYGNPPYTPDKIMFFLMVIYWYVAACTITFFYKRWRR